ncbi:anaphase promoting complex subunit 4 [Dissophora globulifera]|nr:anaphase promoting complex subunit 4 [Dissophora globulifera]
MVTQQQMMAARSMFNKPSAQSGGAGLGGAESGPMLEEDVIDMDEESSDIMNVLFAGDSCAEFKLRMFGGFETNAISLLDLIRSFGIKDFETLNVMKVDIRLDLSEFVVMALGSRTPLQPTATQVSKAPDQYLLQINISSDLLHTRPHEIRTLGLKIRPVNQLLQYLADGLVVMQAEYKKIRQMVDDCIDSIQNSLDNNGETTTPTYEFIQLLLTGRPSISIDQYLQQELRRHGLKRWDKSANAAYSNIQRIAFECLLPACERLLLHLSDILGCSRWQERYSQLQLEESQVYNCIKIVGDFMGSIERLFLDLKVEMKQFREFENWLGQVLEMLQPTIRGPDDPGDEDTPKRYPPIDILSVSEYLESGLSSRGLQGHFHEPRATPGHSGDTMDRESDPGLTVAEERQDAELGHSSTPSYPVIYSFSNELKDFAHEKELKSASSTESWQRPQTADTRKSGSNPFAGLAIAAALKGRGFGIIPSKKSGSPSLFSGTSTSPAAQPAHSGLNFGGASAGSLPTPTLQSQPNQPTLEKHLKLMTRQCQLIFKGPSDAVSKSMKVTHVLELSSVETPVPTPDHGSRVGSSKQPSTSRDDFISGRLKLATRYCYHDLVPWHYLALYLPSPDPTIEPTLCILRSRRKSPLAMHARDYASESNHDTRIKTADTTSGAKGVGGGLSSSGIGQKRSASETETTAIRPPSKSRVKSLVTPIGKMTLPETARAAASSDNTEEHTHIAGDLELDVAMFTLREYETADDEKSVDVAELKELGQGQSKRPCYDIRDITFLDDDTICVILNSHSTISTTQATSLRQEQFLVSLHLQSPGRPYQQIPPSDIPMGSSSTLIPTPLLDRIASLAMSPPYHSSPQAPPPLFSVYTLPVSRSRRLAAFADPSLQEFVAGVQTMDGDHQHRPHSIYLTSPAYSTATPPLRSEENPSISADQGRELAGACRIASNEREKKRVVSVHGPSHEGAAILQGAGRITVFEL